MEQHSDSYRSPIFAAFRLMGRTLSFRAKSEDFERATWHALVLGVIATWLAGVGRYWDDPLATTFQQTGIGSVIYVLILSTLVFLFMWPLAMNRLSYWRVATFITMTAPLAFVYAIPVELWVSMPQAQTINLWFLLVVAAYRVSLYVRFLFQCCRLSIFDTILAALLPLMIIMVVLVISGLEAEILDIMGGLRERDPHVRDIANNVVAVMGGFSCLGIVPAAIAYVWRWNHVAKQREKRARYPLDR